VADIYSTVCATNRNAEISISENISVFYGHNKMEEEEIRRITWKSGCGRLHLCDLRKYGIVVIKCVLLKKFGINVGGRY
jgi:hypothetical protein